MQRNTSKKYLHIISPLLLLIFFIFLVLLLFLLFYMIVLSYSFFAPIQRRSYRMILSVLKGKYFRSFQMSFMVLNCHRLNRMQMEYEIIDLLYVVYFPLFIVYACRNHFLIIDQIPLFIYI